jgi:retron-type reverse transcriptase
LAKKKEQSLEPEDCYFIDEEDGQPKKKQVYFRKTRHGRGQITEKGSTITYKGDFTVSKIFFNRPFVLSGVEHRNICSLCINRHACWQAKNHTNRRNCGLWLMESICSMCDGHRDCYGMVKAQCARMADEDEEFGFKIDGPVHVEKLKLEDLRTTFDLGMAIGRKNRLITWLLRGLAKKEDGLYNTWTIPKRSGAQRVITSPNSKLKWVQRSILEKLLYQIPDHESSVGFQPGINIAHNAKVHAGADVVVSIDLQDFFPTVTAPRVFGALKSVGFQKRMAGIITALCTWQGALPQGAPTSPRLANMVCYRMDNKIRSYLNRIGWRYTRYADDITMSFRQSDKPDFVLKSVDGIVSVIRRIIKEEAFQVNENKTKIMRRGRRQWVTGLVANQQPNILKGKFKQVRAAIHKASMLGLQQAAIERGISQVKYAQWVSGNIAFFHMVNPEKTAAMKSQWEEVLSNE